MERKDKCNLSPESFPGLSLPGRHAQFEKQPGKVRTEQDLREARMAENSPETPNGFDGSDDGDVFC